MKALPWWSGGPKGQVQLREGDSGFELVVTDDGEDKLAVVLTTIELMFLGDALGVIKDRWINAMGGDYEFAD
tara:strand:- start:16914 stop:17129 length:216 start_codon:yes stop_codon:yes gene_type:complete